MELAGRLCQSVTPHSNGSNSVRNRSNSVTKNGVLRAKVRSAQFSAPWVLSECSMSVLSEPSETGESSETGKPSKTSERSE